MDKSLLRALGITKKSDPVMHALLTLQAHGVDLRLDPSQKTNKLGKRARKSARSK